MSNWAAARTSRPSHEGPGLWAHVLRDQLDFSEATFWAVVHDGVVPPRGAAPEPTETLPVGVALLLLNRVGLTREEIAAMTRAEGIGRLVQFWRDGF